MSECVSFVVFLSFRKASARARRFRLSHDISPALLGPTGPPTSIIRFNIILFSNYLGYARAISFPHPFRPHLRRSRESIKRSEKSFTHFSAPCPRQSDNHSRSHAHTTQTHTHAHTEDNLLFIKETEKGIRFNATGISSACRSIGHWRDNLKQGKKGKKKRNTKKC